MKRLQEKSIQTRGNIVEEHDEHGRMMVVDYGTQQTVVYDPNMQVPHQGKADYQTKRKGRRPYWAKKES